MIGSRTLALGGALVLALNANTRAADPPADRVANPQRLVIEVFNEPGTPKLPVEYLIEGQPVSLTSLFAPAGIRIEVVYRDEALPKPKDFGDREWLQAVHRLQTPGTPDAWYAAIAVVSDNENGILSMLPDPEERRTAIVYAVPNQQFKDPGLAMFRNAAHEVTHILNLHHQDWEGKTFTEDSTLEGYAEATSTRWRLSEASLEHLRHAPDDFVRPGGVEFGLVLPEHQARHQRTPDEQYTVWRPSAEPVAPRTTTRTIPPPGLGPIILVRSDLQSGQSTTRESVPVFLAVEAGHGGPLKNIVVTLAFSGGEKELRSVGSPAPDRQDLDLQVPLKLGSNRISVKATDVGGYVGERALTILREDIQGKPLAVVFGVQDYTNVHPLKHTVQDARSVSQALRAMGVEEGRLFYKENPDLRTLKTGLGVFLKQQAGPKDLVIVYFAGHGAADIDADSKDGDNLTKYLLPVEAELANLYATALPMQEIGDLLARVKARTTLVILDACFSGSAGGRAVAAENNRATTNLASGFMGRNAGAGRAILAASGANEAAQESEQRGHGLFTYFLLEALAGKADTRNDGAVTLLELVEWVVEQVRNETGGKQTPTFWGEVREPPVLWRRP